jgi:hypothetical protein
MVDSNDRVAKVQKLYELEREHDLFSFRVDGWSAWRVLRFPVHELVMGLPFARPVRPTLVRSLEALAATVKLLWLIAMGRPREFLFKTRWTALRLRREQLYRDLYFDALLEDGHSALKVVEANSPAFSKQAAAAWRQADLDPVAITFWGRILGGLFPPDAAVFCNTLSDILRCEVQTSVAPRALLMMVSTVYWQSRLYGALIKSMGLRATLIAETGDYALRIASNRHNIPVVELQHGMFDAEHPDAVPSWVDGTDAALVLPDVMACYGEFWIDQLAGTRQGDHRAVAIGNELIDLARQRSRDRAIGQAIHIVVTSQGLDSRRLVRWLNEMVASAPGSRDWRMSIKLHPVNDANADEFEPLKGDDRIKIIDGANDPTVYDLLSDADLHLSIASACHFDAAALGVRTVIIPLAGHEPLLKFIDNIHFCLAREPSDAWSMAARAGFDSENAACFSAPGFVNNLQSLVSRFLADRTLTPSRSTSVPASDQAKTTSNV